ncbi:hypothetical protein [Oceanirhabdus seepicola]|uniref:Flagellar hook-length control protein FliK n=1 Tax=Oceanirhabdus seepicola TaxID=2828781 RepID=A0A9J6P140_9CLOT|nr:hypothetical protein [Oceanirhabdus seepicola]MCM1990375.1 hypothetical protein [Oceanirhabdus seepicola]
MSDIRSISGLRQIDKKRMHKKISFSEGEVVRAKVKGTSEDKTVLLRTIDGWEFEAELDESIDSELLNKFAKFKVSGFKEGKLQLKLVEGFLESGSNKSSVDTIIEKLGLKKDEETMNLLKLMIKFKMPLTKENISSIKSLLQFQTKLNENENEKIQFTQKFIFNKGLQSDKSKSEMYSKLISGSLDKLKSIDTKSLIFILKNNITPSGKNIEVLENLSSNKENVFSSFKEMKEILVKEGLLDRNNVSGYNGNKISGNEQKEFIGMANKNTISNAVNKYSAGENKKIEFIEKMISDILQESSQDDLKRLKELKNEISFKEIESNIESDDGKVGKEKAVKESTNKEITKENINKEVNKEVTKEENKEVNKEVTKEENKEVTKENMNKEIIKDSKLITSDKVKKEINEVLKDSKEMLKMILSKDYKESNELTDKLQGFIDNNINKFKVFNSISNQYYYFDSPFKHNDEEYPFKFIIKDDRKKEKKIDSKNVKMIVSLKTKNIGTIDSLIKIRNNNLTINLKCDSKWKKVIEMTRSKLEDMFSESKFLINISVEEREEEINIINCNDFFEDDNFSVLNVRV